MNSIDIIFIVIIIVVLALAGYYVLKNIMSYEKCCGCSNKTCEKNKNKDEKK